MSASLTAVRDIERHTPKLGDSMDDVPPGSTILRRVSNWRGSRVLVPEEQSPISVARSDGARNDAKGPDLLAGDVVGEYVIVRKLGEGGFGTVYEAAHPVIGKRAAVKLLHAQYSADESITSRFVAEARAVNQIRNKNIVDIFGFGDLPDGRHYYVMELLEGVALDAYLDKVTRLPKTSALPILQGIAKAISAAHEAGIAHRDLKPENVFLELDSDGFVQPKILDFGMAKLLTQGAVPIHKTQSGAPIGSPRYMSPEQCRGVAVDGRTDVYAFGCIAYRMLTGVTPFDSATALELMMAHVSAQPPPPSSQYSELGAEFDEPILRMLEKQPDARPQTLTHSYEMLRAAATRQGISIDDSGIRLAEPFREMVLAQRQTQAPAVLRVSPHRTPRDSVPPRHAVNRKVVFGSALVVTALLALAYYVGANRLFGLEHRREPIVNTTAESNFVASPATETLSRGRTETSPQTAANRVFITLTSQPQAADVYLNDKRLGLTPGPFELERSSQPVVLEVRASGYVSATVSLVPLSDLEQKVALSRKQRRPKNAKTPGDLEDPY